MRPFFCIVFHFAKSSLIKYNVEFYQICVNRKWSQSEGSSSYFCWNLTFVLTERMNCTMSSEPFEFHFIQFHEHEYYVCLCVTKKIQHPNLVVMYHYVYSLCEYILLWLRRNFINVIRYISGCACPLHTHYMYVFYSFAKNTETHIHKLTEWVKYS